MNYDHTYYYVYAHNMKTGEHPIVGIYDTLEEATYDVENNIVFEEDDCPADWTFEILLEEI